MCLCCWNVFEKEKINAKSESLQRKRKFSQLEVCFHDKKKPKKKHIFVHELFPQLFNDFFD